MKTLFYKLLRIATFCGLIAGASESSAQCTAITGLTITSRGCDSIGISWTPSTGANIVNYSYSVSTSTSNPTSSSITTGNSVEVGNLGQGTLYWVHVRTNCVGGTSTWVKDTIRTCGTYCAPPSNPGYVTTSDSATITWQAVAGALGYEWILDQTFNTPTTPGTFTTGNTATVTGLTSGTSYFWHIRTKCSPTANSQWRQGVRVETTGFDPGCVAPASITATIRRCDSVNLSWPGVTGANSYNVALTQTPSLGTNYSVLTGTSVEWPLLLSASTLYYMHIRRDCSLSKGQWRVDTFRTPGCAIGGSCPTVAAITTTIRSCDSATFAWTALTGVQNYNWAVTQSATPPAGGIQVSNSFNIGKGGLTPSTLYYIHVRSNCPGTNAWKTDTFTTPSCGGLLCLAPATVSINNVTTNSATFTWAAAANAIGYEYVLDQSTANPTAGGTLVTATTILGIPSLAPSTTYYFHIRTKCDATTFSGWKPALQVITNGPPPACLPPATVTTSSITTTTADLSWTTAVGAIGYEYVLNQTSTSPTTSGTQVNANSTSTTSLIPNTTYYFHIRTQCDATTFSPWKPATSFITQQVTGINNNGHEQRNILAVYPNPANQVLTIEMSNKPGKNAKLELFSIDGKKVRSLVPLNSTTLQINDLENGIYYLRYSDDDGSETARFTKY